MTLWAGLCALLVGLMLALAPAFAPAAYAHDSLTGSDPGEGEAVQTAEGITLTFSARPLELSAQVRATDSAGTILFDGEPRIEDNSVIAEFTEAPAAGDVTVQWRVVSSDGHPIEGTTTFTITAEPNAEPPAGAPSSASSVSPSAQATETAAPSQNASAAPTDQAGEKTALSPAVIATGIIVAIALVVGVVVMVTRRRE